MDNSREKFPIFLPLGLLLLGFALILALNWPGQMSYDSVVQLADARSGEYDSWHPPVMAWLLGLGDHLMPGPGLFLLFVAGLLLDVAAGAVEGGLVDVAEADDLAAAGGHRLVEDVHPPPAGADEGGSEGLTTVLGENGGHGAVC